MEESEESDVNRDATAGPSGDPGRLSTVESFHQKSPRPASLGRRITGPTRRSTNGIWTKEADMKLAGAVEKHGAKNWRAIAKEIPGCSDIQCLHRWQKVLDPNIVKGPWSKEEDDLLIQLVGKQEKSKINWSKIAKHVRSRGGKQCRERWYNHLRPGIKTDPWTTEEELVLISAHEKYGNKWAEIAKLLPGRTENAIKNLWNSSLKNRAENCSTSYPDRCCSPSNKERRSRSPEAKPEIDLLHEKQRNCGSPREVADSITDCSMEIASDRKGIGASASTCKRNDLATLAFPEAEANKRIDPIHFLLEPLQPTVMASLRCGKSSWKFIHLNSLLPPNRCPCPSSASITQPGPLHTSSVDNAVPPIDFRSSISRLRRAASSYRNVPSIIRSSKNLN